MKEKQHLNFRMVDCGFFISTEYPFIGASPDSLISCDCSGEGRVEVKCPYCKRSDTVDEASNTEPMFCILSGCLSITHPYYAQIQTQMNGCNSIYCDFFLWAKKDYFCQRIMQHKNIWKTYVEKAELVIRNGVLPEIIGKCFTRVPAIGEMYPCFRAECQLK